MIQLENCYNRFAKMILTELSENKIITWIAGGAVRDYFAGVYFAPTAFMDLAKRQLMINKITYPASTMSRAFKYYKKGFIMCKGEMKKMVEAIQNMEKKAPVDTQETTEETETSGDSIFSGID